MCYWISFWVYFLESTLWFSWGLVYYVKQVGKTGCTLPFQRTCIHPLLKTQFEISKRILLGLKWACFKYSFTSEFVSSEYICSLNFYLERSWGLVIYFFAKAFCKVGWWKIYFTNCLKISEFIIINIAEWYFWLGILKLLR